MPLAFLSLNLTRRALEGLQSPDLTADRLIKAAELPLDSMTQEVNLDPRKSRSPVKSWMPADPLCTCGETDRRFHGVRSSAFRKYLCKRNVGTTAKQGIPT